MTERRASIRDVAKRAGVSPTTVSFVLNDRGHISEKTRKRVFDAIDELGYRPDLRARSLKSRRIQTIALLFVYSEESLASSRYFRDLTASICATASKLEYRVMVSLHMRGQSLAEQVKVLRQDGLSSGVIVVGPTPEEVNLIAESLGQFPGLVVSATSTHPNNGYIHVDNARGMRLAIEHLVALGHRRIAYVGPTTTSSHTVARLAAYTEAMTDAEIEGREHVFLISHEDDSQLSALLDAAPTAVIAFDDLRAILVRDFLRHRGLRVPEDIALIGFDDENFGLHISPRLTTLAQPFNKMGRLAAEKLIEHIENPSAGLVRITLSLRLVVRESCGAYLAARS